MNELEINQFYKKLSPHFINVAEGVVNIRTSSNMPTSPVLLTQPEMRIAGFATYSSTVESLLTFNTTERWNLYTKNPTDISVRADEIWRVKYNKIKETWEINNNFSEQELYTCILLNQKLKAIDHIIHTLCHQKYSLSFRTPYEQHLMLGKAIESKEILDKNITEDLLMNYPITSVYAGHRAIPLQQAAEELQFEVKNDMNYIAELEGMRLRFSKIICDEKKIENLKPILNEVVYELYEYSRFGVA